MPRSKTTLLDDIEIGKRHRKDMGDLKELAQSIDAEGLLQPIGLTPDKQLVFGMRRFLAVRDILGWDRIQAVTVNVSSIVAGEYAENEVRKDFTLSERDGIRRTLEKKIGDRQGQRTDKQLPANCPEVQPGEETRDLTSRQAGFENVTEARRVREVTTKGTPALVDAMDRGALPVSVAAKVAELPKAKQNEIAKSGKPRVAAKDVLTPKKQKYTLSEWFIESLRLYCGTVEEVERQFEDISKMFKSPEWDKRTTTHAAMLLDKVCRHVNELNKKVQKYVRIQKEKHG